MENGWLNVLLVEDDPGDVDLAKMAIEAGDVHFKIHSILDGDAALDYLRQNPPHEKAVRPDLIILDLNMPKKNGQEVLAELASDDSLKDIPVAIFSTSRVQKDIITRYGLNEDLCFTKPLRFDDYVAFMKSLDLRFRRERP